MRDKIGNLEMNGRKKFGINQFTLIPLIVLIGRVKKNTIIKLTFLICMFGLLTACEEKAQEVIQKPEETIEVLSQETPTELKYQVVDENSRMKGELWTNYDSGGKIHNDVVRIPVETPLYDASFVVYSEKFANRHGFPDSHIAKLSSELQLMELKITTRGLGVSCLINFLIDKGTGHVFEGKNSFHRFFELGNRFYYGVPIHFPRREKDFQDSEKDFRFQGKYRDQRKYGEEKFTNQSFFIAGQDYTPSKSRGGSYLTAFLQDYHGYMFEGLDYFSVAVGCGSLPLNNIKQPNSMIWIKKKDAPDYGRRLLIKAEDFVKVPIPDEIRSQYLKYSPMIKSTGPNWEKASKEVFGYPKHSFNIREN